MHEKVYSVYTCFSMHLDLSNHEVAVKHENVRLSVQKSHAGIQKVL